MRPSSQEIAAAARRVARRIADTYPDGLSPLRLMQLASIEVEAAFGHRDWNTRCEVAALAAARLRRWGLRVGHP